VYCTLFTPFLQWKRKKSQNARLMQPDVLIVNPFLGGVGGTQPSDFHSGPTAHGGRLPCEARLSLRRLPPGEPLASRQTVFPVGKDRRR